MKTIFKFIHPTLPIFAGLFGLAAYLFGGPGGPCASPTILIFPVLFIGICIGLVLSVIRSERQMSGRAKSDKDRKDRS
jgi:hypothetical protein